MQKFSSRNLRLNHLPLSLGMLLFLAAYTYGILFLAPYPGFYSDPATGEIMELYGPESSALQKGDIIESVGSISLEDLLADRNLNPFQGVERGATIQIVVTRNGEPLTVDWVYPGFTWDEFPAHFFNIWWLSYLFWAIGAYTQLSMRPKDSRWRLFVAMNYLLALFIMFGAVSSFRILWSAILLRAAAWFLPPVYLHFHWNFPAPLKPLPRWLLVLIYAACSVAAIGELFQLLPRTSYFWAVVLAFAGSILLLICHYIFQREYRRDVRFLAAAAFLSMFFAILIGVSGSNGSIPQSGPLAFFALPILPGAYFYVLYQRRLGGLELRTNRAVSLYLFLLLLAGIFSLVLGYSNLIDIRRETIVFATMLIAVFAAGLGALVFPAFQTFVDRRMLGVKIPSERLTETFSARIIASDTLDDLMNLLGDEVFPSLFVRQYVLVRNSNPSAQVMLSYGVTSDEVREEALTEWLASFSTLRLRSVQADGLNRQRGIDPPFDWVRLVLPLQVGPDLIGVWLLGRRDPDDHYPQAEFPILRSLADQTAIALSNIIQTERLKAMYHANITRYEEERNRLGRDLHDSVLNEMAVILDKHQELSQVPGFEESYKRLIQQIREIVSDLRPPSLMYGLKFALEGLADHLSERHHDKPRIRAEIRMDGMCRYPEIVENYLYRIVQEACENALKYSRANSITITGELREGEIRLDVVDDGIGFTAEINLPLDDMVANKHYGLAGMHERADLIGAVVRITSKPVKGTQIHVSWGVKKTI
jgi:signal transduction histidine kinase